MVPIQRKHKKYESAQNHATTSYPINQLIIQTGILTMSIYSRSALIQPLFVTTLFLIACASNVYSEDALKVLMLGDSGFHKPSGFFRTIEVPLKKSGIELRYTQNLSDVNAVNLKGFAGLLIFANIERITPEAESYMHSRHNPDRIVLETRSDASGPVSDPNGEPYTWIRESSKGRVDYPNELQPVGQGRDRIKICEDTDNDGHADKFTVFAEHLSIPSTLVCYRGGVIVQDGQSTIYLKDTDGDDAADFRQVLITGWAMGDTHGGVSNFQYGPDNWIWGMQGYNNSTPVINGEKKISFRQGFWRFKVNVGAADNTAPAFAIDKSTKEAAKDATDTFNNHTIRVAALEFMRATNNNTSGFGEQQGSSRKHGTILSGLGAG